MSSMGKQSPVRLLIADMLMSMLAALSAIMLLQGLGDSATRYFAADFGLETIAQGSRVLVITPPEDAAWTFDALVTVLLSRPVTFFVVAMLSLWALMVIRVKSAWFMDFLFWLSVMGMSGALGQLLYDGIFGVGTHAVTLAMHFNYMVLVILAFVALYFLVLMGILLGRIFLIHRPEIKPFSFAYRLQSMAVLIWIPWLLSVLWNGLLAGQMAESRLLIMDLAVLPVILPVAFMRFPKVPADRIPVRKVSTTADWLIGMVFIVTALMLKWWI